MAAGKKKTARAPARKRARRAHHSVYVIELDGRVLNHRRFRDANPNRDAGSNSNSVAFARCMYRRVHIAFGEHLLARERQHCQLARACSGRHQRLNHGFLRPDLSRRQSGVHQDGRLTRYHGSNDSWCSQGHRSGKGCCSGHLQADDQHHRAVELLGSGFAVVKPIKTKPQLSAPRLPAGVFFPRLEGGAR